MASSLGPVLRRVAIVLELEVRFCVAPPAGVADPRSFAEGCFFGGGGILVEGEAASLLQLALRSFGGRDEVHEVPLALVFGARFGRGRLWRGLVVAVAELEMVVLLWVRGKVFVCNTLGRDIVEKPILVVVLARPNLWCDDVGFCGRGWPVLAARVRFTARQKFAKIARWWSTSRAWRDRRRFERWRFLRVLSCVGCEWLYACARLGRGLLARSI